MSKGSLLTKKQLRSARVLTDDSAPDGRCSRSSRTGEVRLSGRLRCNRDLLARRDYYAEIVTAGGLQLAVNQFDQTSQNDYNYLAAARTTETSCGVKRIPQKKVQTISRVTPFCN
jgi:hypothetical protein